MLITLHRLGKPAEAEAMLNQYVQPETTDRRWLLLARGFYAGTGQQDKALMMVERLALLAPAGPQRDMQLAAIYLQTERAQKAADLLIKTVSNWPVQTQQTGKSANGAVANTPASPPPPVMPDGSVMENGDENDLSQEVDEAVEAGINGPGLDEALGLLARALIRLERGNEIDGWFEKAIGRHPQEEATLRLQWAMMLQRMGKTSLGEAQLHRVLKLKPDDGPALNALGYGWADQGIQLPQAKAMIEKALSQEPENPAYLDSMGWVEYKLGRFPQAVEWLTKARMRPGGDHPVILDHLGDALWRAGRKTEALRYWQVALDGITPDMVKDDPEVSRLQSLLPAKIAEATADREPATAAVGQTWRHPLRSRKRGSSVTNPPMSYQSRDPRGGSERWLVVVDGVIDPELRGRRSGVE
ncbi:MAG: hypothetical protein HC898_04745 [Phycisphaerales bacterium]|nr:hypothetical protein [Phycisphaerales bacterium]